MESRYNYRLRVSPVQERLLHQVFDSTRFVWNHILGRWSDLWRHEGESLSSTEACKELTDLRSRFDWLSEQPAGSQQQVIRDLYKSISSFFDKKNPAGRPKFKKKGTYSTARWTKDGFSIKDDYLSVVTSAGRINLRVVWSRHLPSPPTSVTIYRDLCGHWYASFVTRIEEESIPSSNRVTGLDLGLTTFATTEFEEFDIPNPRFAKKVRAQQKKADQALSRKTKGSNNRAKAKLRRAKVHAHVANQRKDFHQKQARTLARSFDRIGVEDLRIKNMLANRHLSRAISDAGWREFLLALDWQAKKVGREVVPLNPRNTTQTCSGCGTKAKSHLGLKDRVFSCESCGLIIDRDRNAAHNLNPGRADPGAGVDCTKSLTPEGAEAA